MVRESEFHSLICGQNDFVLVKVAASTLVFTEIRLGTEKSDVRLWDIVSPSPDDTTSTKHIHNVPFHPANALNGASVVAKTFDLFAVSLLERTNKVRPEWGH